MPFKGGNPQQAIGKANDLHLLGAVFALQTLREPVGRLSRCLRGASRRCMLSLVALSRMYRPDQRRAIIFPAMAGTAKSWPSQRPVATERRAFLLVPDAIVLRASAVLSSLLIDLNLTR